MILKQQSKNKKFLLAIFAILLISGIICTVWLQSKNGMKEREAIQNLVQNFGNRLQNIPLLAPQDVLRKSLEDNFGPLTFPSSTIIAQWTSEALDDPTKVPGRITSSPWPDRIEILNMKKLSKYAYEIDGEVIEVTSTGISAKRPITILVEKRRDQGNRWFITNVTLDFYKFSNNQKEEAITNYLLTQKDFSWTTTIGSKNFCVIENLLDQENNLFPYYVWARCGEFIIRDGMLKELSGSSGPVKIDYPNELSFYDLSRFSHDSPGDGSQYTEDVKRIFPEQVQTRIFNFQQDGIDEVNRKIEMAAVEWFSSDQVIGADNLWEIAKLAIKNCEVEQGFQAHSRLVRLTLKNGQILTAIEPKIDDIFTFAEDPKVIETCGKIRIATE